MLSHDLNDSQNHTVEICLLNGGTNLSNMVKSKKHKASSTPKTLHWLMIWRNQPFH